MLEHIIKSHLLDCFNQNNFYIDNNLNFVLLTHACVTQHIQFNCGGLDFCIGIMQFTKWMFNYLDLQNAFNGVPHADLYLKLGYMELMVNFYKMD